MVLRVVHDVFEFLTQFAQVLCPWESDPKPSGVMPARKTKPADRIQRCRKMGLSNRLGILLGCRDNHFQDAATNRRSSLHLFSYDRRPIVHAKLNRVELTPTK